MTSYLIKGVSLLGAAPADLLIRDGVIATGTDAHAEVIDAAGLVALPGLVD
ncbi:dihydroorotase, partial [Actinoplanes sp. NPDC048791]